MSNELLQQLEIKVDAAIEAIELQRLQVEELEDNNKKLQEENTNLIDANKGFEAKISSLVEKLARTENFNKQETQANTFANATEMEPA